MPVRTPGPSTNGVEAQVLLAHRHPLLREPRHHRGDAHLVDRLREAQAEQREEALQQTGDLVARAMPDCGDAPVVDQHAAVDSGR